jgi:hypothetical protein
VACIGLIGFVVALIWLAFVPGQPLAQPQTAESTAQKLYEEAVTRIWSDLLHNIDAKLCLIQKGHSTVEDEFLAAILLPDGARRRVARATDRAGLYEQHANPASAEIDRLAASLLPGQHRRASASANVRQGALILVRRWSSPRLVGVAGDIGH